MVVTLFKGDSYYVVGAASEKGKGRANQKQTAGVAALEPARNNDFRYDALSGSSLVFQCGDFLRLTARRIAKFKRLKLAHGLSPVSWMRKGSAVAAAPKPVMNRRVLLLVRHCKR